jgi:hypothetical protein
MENHTSQMLLKKHLQELKEKWARIPPAPEPRYECVWCHDYGTIATYNENGVNYLVKFADSRRVEMEKRHLYFRKTPCMYCEAGER